MLLGRTDCGEHAELAESPLSDDGESRGGNERGQEQEDGGHREHRERVRGLVSPRIPVPRRPERPAGWHGVRESELDRRLASTRTVTCRARSRGRRGDEGELVAELSGFSTMPTTVRDGRRERASPPSSSARSSATPSVTATCRARPGTCPGGARAARRRRRRAGPARGTPRSRRCRARRSSGGR